MGLRPAGRDQTSTGRKFHHRVETMCGGFAGIEAARHFKFLLDGLLAPFEVAHYRARQCAAGFGHVVFGLQQAAIGGGEIFTQGIAIQ